MDKPPVKLSTKVLKELLTLLREGFFGDAETLPREEDLAKILQVSRTVIRDVLKILEQEGYIIRVKKKGTVINRKVLGVKFRLDIEYEFRTLLEMERYRHGSRVLGVDRFPAGEELKEIFRCKGEDEIIRIRKIITADSQPVIYCEDYLLKNHFREEVPREDLFLLNVYDVLEKYCQERIDFNVTNLVPILADEKVREHLDYQGPMLMVKEEGFTSQLKPILYSNIYWRGDFFDFHIIRKRY